MPRFNLDVCLPRKRPQHEWLEVVSFRSRATDDSGWTEGAAANSKREILVHCQTSDIRSDVEKKTL